MDYLTNSGTKKKKKNIIMKTWERCRSICSSTNMSNDRPGDRKILKSKSWPRSRRGGQKTSVAPEGCFSIYVGPSKQRFVMKAKFANHPLFMALLEEAESEFGYNSEGPLMLPGCDVEMFLKVLREIDSDNEAERFVNQLGYRLVKGSYGSGSYQHLCRSPMVVLNGFDY